MNKRIVSMIQELSEQEKCVNISDLAEKFEVSERMHTGCQKRSKKRLLWKKGQEQFLIKFYGSRNMSMKVF